MGDVRIGVEAAPRDAAGWTALVQRIEEMGFDRLLVADHPGSGPAPFVALAAAAGVTERITLGSYVVNAGVWEPLALASQVATLDVVSGGRAVLGVGAGHTPAEWSMRGVSYPSAGARVDRMIELVDATQRLLTGQTVSVAGDHITLDEAHLAEPRPFQAPVPLLVGGNGRRVLRYAAERADVVGLTGLGRTLEDGHRHEVRWSGAQIDATIAHVRTIADAAGRSPQLEALVQHVQLTDDAEAAATELAAGVPGLTAEQVLGAPFVWIGTSIEIATEVEAHRARWGIERYVVREAAMDAAADVLGHVRASA